MRSLLSFLLGTALILSGALLIQRYIAKPFLIPSKSMAKTLGVGDRIMVTRIASNLKRGDVVVFYAPRGAEEERCGSQSSGPGTGKPCSRSWGGKGSQPYVKRIVGLPGDLIAIKEGVLIRNEKPVKESYTSPCLGSELCEMPIPIRVPPGRLFMMGDNRANSADSRIWGPVHRSWILGEARLIWWPPSRLGGL